MDVITGAGKTVLACQAMEELWKVEKNLSVRVVVPTQNLMQQWIRNLRQFFRDDIRIGEYSSDYKSDAGSRILVCVVNSARMFTERQWRDDSKQKLFWLQMNAIIMEAAKTGRFLKPYHLPIH